MNLAWAVFILICIGAALVGIVLVVRPRSDQKDLDPERSGTSYEKPQDEGPI